MTERDYKIEIFWSHDDACFIANVPELKYCSAHGDTREDALREIQVALKACLEALAEERGGISDALPETFRCDKCGGTIYEDEGECLHEMLCDDCLRARENPEIYGEDDA